MIHRQIALDPIKLHNPHSAAATNAENNRLLLVKGTGGLGNRILAVLSALLFAELSRRKALIDWTDEAYGPNPRTYGAKHNMFSSLFNRSLVDCWEAKWECEDVLPSVWRGRLHMSASSLTKEVIPKSFNKFGAYHYTSINVDNLNQKAKLLVYWSWRERIQPMRPLLTRALPELASLNDLNLLRRVAKTYLVPNKQLEDAASEILRRCTSGPVVGLHVRFTDMKAPVERLFKRTDKVVTLTGAKNLLVSTDNPMIIEKAKARWTKLNIVVSEKQFSESGRPLHWDPDCEDRLRRAYEAIIEMLLLSRCDRLVFASRSSFAYVAHVFASEKQIADDVDRFLPTLFIKRLVQKYWYR